MFLRNRLVLAIIIIFLVSCGERKSNDLIIDPVANNATTLTQPSIARVKPSTDYKDNLELIKKLVANELSVNVDKLSYEVDLLSKEIGADDLDMVAVVLAIEDTFGVSISDEELDRFSWYDRSRSNRDIAKWDATTIEALAKIVASHAKN
jgi:acyl carrier protein